MLVEQVAHPSRFAVVDSWESGAKNACFAPFYTKNDHFAKTGSGQTWGKLEQRGVFSGRLLALLTVLVRGAVR